MPVRPVASFQGYGTRFGAPQINTGYSGTPANHLGEDLMAKAGTAAQAFVAGVIAQVHNWTGSKNDPYGNYLDLKGADGNTYRYAHLQSIGVAPGQRVGEGAVLGAVGSTGNATGPHLHFEVIQPNGQRTNPDPYIRSATMANSEGAPPNTLTGGNAGPGGAPPPPGGPPGGGDRDPDKDFQKAITEVEAKIAAATASGDTYTASQLEATRQSLLTSWAGYRKAGATPASRDQAAQDLDKAQADAQRAGVDISRAKLDADERQAAADRASREGIAASGNASAQAIAAGNNATDLTQTAMTTGTSREVAQIGAATQRYGYDLQAAQQAANLQWEQEQGRILQAFNEKRFSWEQAVAAATEARERLTAELTQQRNAIEAAGLDVSQRGQDLSAGVTQRGQDLEAQTTVRGQDIGRLNQATQSGASLLGNAMNTAGQIGASTGSTALGALRYYAPANAGEAFNRAGQGQAPNLGTVGMPFDPAAIVQQAADAAYAKFAPPGQALLAAGQAPSPAFVAPGQIAAPPRVASGYAPVQLPPPMLRPGGGGGFVAP